MHEGVPAVVSGFELGYSREWGARDVAPLSRSLYSTCGNGHESHMTDECGQSTQKEREKRVP